MWFDTAIVICIYVSNKPYLGKYLYKWIRWIIILLTGDLAITERDDHRYQEAKFEKYFHDDANLSVQLLERDLKGFDECSESIPCY